MSLKWDKRFLALAEMVATWSKDPSTKCGAVIVRPNFTVASMGYNGFPRGVVDSEDRLNDRPTKYAYTIHAELNAILTAPEPLGGCTLYVVPFSPCSWCAAAIVQSGIRKVVFRGNAPDRWAQSCQDAATMFTEAEVDCHEMRDSGVKVRMT